MYDTHAIIEGEKAERLDGIKIPRGKVPILGGLAYGNRLLIRRVQCRVQCTVCSV